MDLPQHITQSILTLKQVSLPNAQEWGWPEHAHVFQFDSPSVIMISARPPTLSLP